MEDNYIEFEVKLGPADDLWVPGTNRKLYNEYRLGKTDGPFKGKLLLLVRLYSLGQKSWLRKSWPTTWGVSFYKPEDLRAEVGHFGVPFGQLNTKEAMSKAVEGSRMVDMLGPTSSAPASYLDEKTGMMLPSQNTGVRIMTHASLKGYIEYKHHFWTELEARRFYEHLIDERWTA